jgi:hypothetical protein
MVSLVDMAEGIAQRKGYAITCPFLEVVRVERDVISPLIHKTNFGKLQGVQSVSLLSESEGHGEVIKF